MFLCSSRSANAKTVEESIPQPDTRLEVREELQWDPPKGNLKLSS